MSSRQCNQPGRKCNAPRAYLEMGSNLASSADLNLSRMIPFSSSRLCPVLILIHSDSANSDQDRAFQRQCEPFRAIAAESDSSSPASPLPPSNWRHLRKHFPKCSPTPNKCQERVNCQSHGSVVGGPANGRVASPRRPPSKAPAEGADREMRARRAGISCVLLAASSYVVPFQCGPALMLFRLPRRRVPFRSPGSSNFHHVSRGAASHAVCKEDLLGPGTLSQKN
jgi:hypothetical protein